MKALVFSDIHGSLLSAQFMVAEIQRQRPDTVILLGDTLYHGPRNIIPPSYDPRAVAELINSYAGSIIAVRGNCDSEVDQNLLHFPIASEFTWLISEGLRIFITHGHHFSPSNLPPLQEGDILLFGHTHIPLAESTGDIYLCNPGSITLPKDDHPQSFGIIENGTFSVLTKEGEVYLYLNYC